MDADQRGLFELPDNEPLPPAEKLQRGRNREVWTLTATAEVTITDAAALTEAATLANEGFVVTGLEADLGVEDREPEGPPAEPGSDAFDALAWLIWPTQGLERILDVGAARILSVDGEVAADSVDRGTATWRATVKLTDVDEGRGPRAQRQPPPDRVRLSLPARPLVAHVHARRPSLPSRPCHHSDFRRPNLRAPWQYPPWVCLELTTFAWRKRRQANEGSMKERRAVSSPSRPPRTAEATHSLGDRSGAARLGAWVHRPGPTRLQADRAGPSAPAGRVSHQFTSCTSSGGIYGVRSDEPLD